MRRKDNTFGVRILEERKQQEKELEKGICRIDDRKENEI
jgi:hypothetical protein